MHPLTIRGLVGALIAAIAVVTAFFIASQPTAMQAPLQRALPRLKSFLPGLQKPLTASNTLRSAPTLYSKPSRPHNFSTTANMTYDTLTLKDAIHNRRTIYKLTKKSTISDDKLKDILTTAVRDVPSSFNSQSARLVVLVKEEHDKFWQVVTDILKVHVPEDKWEHTGQRLDGFKNAYGTVRHAHVFPATDSRS